MVGSDMIERGVSIRQVAKQFGVRESALRYRLRKRQEREEPDGRTRQPSSLDEYKGAVHTVLKELEDVRITGSGRPAQTKRVYGILCRNHGFKGSYKSVVRYIRREYGDPPVRALRCVETPPGVQAQHDWFEIVTTIAGARRSLPVMVGTLSHSRGRFAWVSERADQLAWHTGHLELFRRYGGVPLWVRIDNLKTGVARGAGATAVLNHSYKVFAREIGFEIDPCRPAKGQDKGKTERSVRTFRDEFGDLFDQDWSDIPRLQGALDERAREQSLRLKCPITGTSVADALAAERCVLQPLCPMETPFDVVVSRCVSRDCLVSFEGRRYSVPFVWLGRQVEVFGTHAHVVIRGGGKDIAQHARHSAALVVLDADHYEGESRDGVLAPVPLGYRGRLQLAGLSSASRLSLDSLPPVRAVRRSIDDYVRLLEVLA